MKNIELRNLKISDVKKLYEIILNPNFIHIVLPKSFESYRRYYSKKLSKRKQGLEFHYAIILNNEFVGTGGIKINEERPYICEIAYIVDERYWNKGIATIVVKQLEQICFKKLKLTKLEIWTNPKNVGSNKVAVKLGFEKEGLLKKRVRERDNKLHDVKIYFKIKDGGGN
jgi:ribosomal-protein-alanine N-acetyltransferase